jgi:hypothetical protein
MAKLTDKKFKKVQENYRKAYPESDLFFTTDGNCFLKKNMAEAHARKEKLEVIPSIVTKQEETATPEGEKTDENDGADKEMTEEKAKELLAGMTLDKDSDYQLLGDIVEALEVEVDGKSKEDRIAALKPVQDELKGE